MNERIRELFEQALEEFKAENKYATIIVPNPLKEKFAELIVRECIDVLQKDLPGEDQVVTRNEVILRACNVAEHFGVEE